MIGKVRLSDEVDPTPRGCQWPSRDEAGVRSLWHRGIVDRRAVAPTSTTHWSRLLPERSIGGSWLRPVSTPPFAELAAAEGVNPSYISRTLRLTLLAPDVVEAILNGRQSAEMTLIRAIGPPPTRGIFNARRPDRWHS